MRLLLLTGRLAYERVAEEARRIEAELGHEADVWALDVDVAALMSTRWLRKALEPVREALGDYDVVILPGYTSGPALELEEEFGIRFVKGTKHICDLSEALRRIGLEGLSGDVPADVLLERAPDVEERLRAVEAAVGAYVEIGSVRVPLRPPPMRVVSEVYYRPGISQEELARECERRVVEGADIVCLGIAEPEEVSPGELGPVLKALRERLPALAIDSPRPAHLEEAIRLGVDMVLSISLDNTRRFLSSVEPDIAYVVVAPREARPEERLRAIKHMISELEGAGAKKIVVDPLLEPPIEPGMTDSLLAYKLIGEELPDYPLLMGLCNALELVDADSHGVAALLVVLAGELDVSLLLTTEESHKARGSTAEVSTAARMASIALHEHRPPKDMGIDLLRLKDKVNRDVGLGEPGLRGVEVVDCAAEEPPLPRALDSTGVFRIAVDREKGLLLALYRGRKGALLLRGPSAKSILREVVGRGLVGTQEHLAYLAVELTKAEIALRTGKSYVQDEGLF